MDSSTIPPTSSSKPLKIAIIGGGLAGASAAGALSKLPNAQIKVYERSAVVREVGALIAVMVSAVKVLRRMSSPAAWAELQRILYRGEGTEGIHHRHWESGEVMATAISPHTPRPMQEGRTGRAPLLNMLMMDVPDGVMQYSREVVRVEPQKDEAKAGAVLHFSDETTEYADLVVVADGIYSRIRRQYIPDSLPQYKGRIAYRLSFPIELVSHIKDLPNDTSSYKRANEVVFLSALDPGTYSFAAFLNEPKEVADTMRWAHSLGRPGVERLKQRLADAGWHPLVRRVLDALPTVDAYPLESARWMAHMVRDDCVAFAGDAAHPTAGAFGTGCAFAFGDAWALYRALHRAHASRPPTMASPNFNDAAVLDPGAISAPPSPSPQSQPSSDDDGRGGATPALSSSQQQQKHGYNLPYALHLYNETRRQFLRRAEQQLAYDKKDVQYCAEAIGDYAEYVRRYRETFTINWWLLEHDVDAKFQEVEARERHNYQP